MCTNKQWVLNRYNGQKYFVPCGHCSACLQEKAIKRSNRIRANQKDIGMPFDNLFVTLTYQNRYIPYISRFQVKQFLAGNIDYINIYRDYTARKYSDFKGSVRRVVNKGRVVLDSFKPEHSCSRDNLLTSDIPLLGITTKLGPDNFVYDINRISVPFLPDIQNFIKRFRINFFRKYGYEKEWSYFYVCELGPSTNRAHFHLLISVECGWFEKAKQCVRESWPYGCFLPKSIQRATNPAAYISSYVNCGSTVPLFLSACKRLSPFHHYSKNFGFGKECFSLSSVVRMFERNDFGFVVDRVKEGVYSRDIVPVPLYVLNKYFRKFKGFSRLSSDEIFTIAENPGRIGQFRKRIEAEDSELRRIYTSLINLREKYVKEILNCDVETWLPFEFVYSRIWSAYNSYKLKLQHDRIKSDFDNLQLYDNLSECFYFSADGESKGFIKNDVIKSIVFDTVNYFPLPVDSNYFPNNLNYTANLTLWFKKYQKKKKESNFVHKKDYM